MDKAQIELLISRVRDIPFLWKKSLKPDDANLISDAWNNVGSGLSPPLPGPQVRQIFEKLESIFVKCTKWHRVTDRSGVNVDAVYTPEWEYYKNLSFLKDQLDCRDTVSNLQKLPRTTLLKTEIKHEEDSEINGDTLTDCKDLSGALNRRREKMLRGSGVHNCNLCDGEGDSERDTTVPNVTGINAQPSTSTGLNQNKSYQLHKDVNVVHFMDLTKTSSSDSGDSDTDLPLLQMINGGFELLSKNILSKADQEFSLPSLSSPGEVFNDSDEIKGKKRLKAFVIDSDIEDLEIEARNAAKSSRKIKRHKRGVKSVPPERQNALKVLEQLFNVEGSPSAVNERLTAAMPLLMSALSSIPEDMQLPAIIKMLEVAQRFKDKKKSIAP